MNPFIIYIIKAAIAYFLCFLVYWILFRKETFFIRNRFYLLLSIILPLVLPFIHFSNSSNVSEIMSNQGMNWLLVLSKTFGSQPASNIDPQVVNNIPSTNLLSFSTIILIIYFAGLIIFLIRIFNTYHNIINLISHSQKRRLRKMILVITKKKISPFSLFKWLVIPEFKKKHPDINKIIQHEMVHCRQNHSVDILLSELLIAFQWFNPFVWLMKSAIIRNNEFIVDHKLMSTDMNLKEYQYSLLTNSFGEKKLAMVNNFNKHLIKKRIKMMNKKQTPEQGFLSNNFLLRMILIQYC